MSSHQSNNWLFDVGCNPRPFRCRKEMHLPQGSDWSSILGAGRNAAKRRTRRCGYPRMLRQHRKRAATRETQHLSRDALDHQALAHRRCGRCGGVSSHGLRDTARWGDNSPLLANIALHGMGEAVRSAFNVHDRPAVIRYADLCRTRHKSAYAGCRVMPTAPAGPPGTHPTRSA